MERQEKMGNRKIKWDKENTEMEDNLREIEDIDEQGKRRRGKRCEEEKVLWR